MDQSEVEKAREAHKVLAQYGMEAIILPIWRKACAEYVAPWQNLRGHQPRFQLLMEQANYLSDIRHLREVVDWVFDKHQYPMGGPIDTAIIAALELEFNINRPGNARDTLKQLIRTALLAQKLVYGPIHDAGPEGSPHNWIDRPTAALFRLVC